MLLDSNIIIYSIQPQYDFLLDFISTQHCFASEISRLEVLGYHRIKDEDKEMFHSIFQNLEMIPLSRAVLEKAIELRQKQAMSLGDSFVAASALIYQQSLVTRNTSDFLKIERLKVVNPFEK